MNKYKQWVETLPNSVQEGMIEAAERGESYTYKAWLAGAESLCKENEALKASTVLSCIQDGSAWICYGEGLIDIRESDNYAYGDSREEAISNYFKALKRGE